VWDCLASILLVSKLEVLADFFAGCEAAALAFGGGDHVGCPLLPTGALLARPVKKFVAEFVQSLLGKQKQNSKYLYYSIT
jgi:hypothetical protein